MSEQKKIKLILYVFEDGTHSIIEPNKEMDSAPSPNTDLVDGGETPTKPPENP